MSIAITGIGGCLRYGLGHKFVAEHGEEFDKKKLIGVPHELYPHKLNTISWQSEGSVLYTTQHDFRAGLAQIIAFAIEKLDLKYRGEGRIVRLGIQTYKAGRRLHRASEPDSSARHAHLPQGDQPHRVDGACLGYVVQ